MPSERSTGLVFTGVSLIVAYLWRDNPIISITALSAAAVLLVLSLTVPKTLRLLNLVWFRVGLALHRVVNPLVMLSIFVVVFLPAGLNEQLIAQAGFKLVRQEDVTENAAFVADRWNNAGRNHKDDLVRIEGEDRFEARQQFFEVGHKLPSERRLLRIL